MIGNPSISPSYITVPWSYEWKRRRPFSIEINDQCEKVKHYGAECKEAWGTVVQYPYQNKTSGTATCYNLQPFSHYNLRFYVKYKYNSYPFKTAILRSVPFNTSESVPDKPTIEFNSRSGRIQWKPLSDCNGKITAYELKVTGKRNYNQTFYESYNITVEQHVTNYTLNLRHGTNYTVEVCGRTAVGTGEASYRSVETEISEPVTPDVSGLKVQNTSVTSVSLLLKRVPETNGPISAYQIIIQEYTSSPKESSSDICHKNHLPAYDISSISDGLYITAEVPAQNLTSSREFIVGDSSVHGGYYNAPLRAENNYTVILRVISQWKKVVKFSCGGYELNFAPPEIVNMSITYDAVKGDTMIRTVRGAPALSITWNVPGGEGTMNSSSTKVVHEKAKYFTTGELHSLSRSGKYTCLTSNVYGSATRVLHFNKKQVEFHLIPVIGIILGIKCFCLIAMWVYFFYKAKKKC
uniref:Uncharacterized protein n=2 Tax=Latimeria chalumnae TaxID=7897 RepID=M3XL83_LATCH|nr:PREDICTED: receptor-type tyrosine-protein phosphatase T-like [Latimeria chalumnae]|eukprot:XP_014347540.1 PREDICTED: receptor-type tyrosine-protein phosphatase T-like [Latimeria chalumnae]